MGEFDGLGCYGGFTGSWLGWVAYVCGQWLPHIGARSISSIRFSVSPRRDPFAVTLAGIGVAYDLCRQMTHWQGPLCLVLARTACFGFFEPHAQIYANVCTSST